MPYTNVITRTDAAALIPEDVSKDIVQGAREESVIMRLARRLANMPRKQHRMPVLSLFPIAYFVDTAPEDKALKQTTEVNWESKYINAEEIAVIVPIPEAVLDDVDYDIWSEIRPLISEEFGRVFDAAVLFGTNAPGTWPTDVLAAAVAAGNSVVLGAGADIYEDICDVGGVIAAVEADGFMHNGAVAAMGMRAQLRGLRDADGNLIFSRSMQDASPYQLDGESMYFPRNGCWDVAQAHLILGDWTQLVYSLRQDITYKLLTEAVIQDAAGNIVYNLPQQDMVALRAVMRLGWQVPNPINRMEEDEDDRYPFAALIP